jgi:hypothetical protein
METLAFLLLVAMQGTELMSVSMEVFNFAVA